MWLNRASRCKYNGKWMETEKTTWLEFPNGNKAPEETNKSKRAELW